MKVSDWQFVPIKCSDGKFLCSVNLGMVAASLRLGFLGSVHIRFFGFENELAEMCSLLHMAHNVELALSLRTFKSILTKPAACSPNVELYLIVWSMYCSLLLSTHLLS